MASLFDTYFEQNQSTEKENIDLEQNKKLNTQPQMKEGGSLFDNYFDAGYQDTQQPSTELEVVQAETSNDPTLGDLVSGLYEMSPISTVTEGISRGYEKASQGDTGMLNTTGDFISGMYEGMTETAGSGYDKVKDYYSDTVDKITGEKQEEALKEIGVETKSPFDQDVQAFARKYMTADADVLEGDENQAKALGNWLEKQAGTGEKFKVTPFNVGTGTTNFIIEDENGRKVPFFDPGLDAGDLGFIVSETGKIAGQIGAGALGKTFGGVKGMMAAEGAYSAAITAQEISDAKEMGFIDDSVNTGKEALETGVFDAVTAGAGDFIGAKVIPGIGNLVDKTKKGFKNMIEGRAFLGEETKEFAINEIKNKQKEVMSTIARQTGGDISPEAIKQAISENKYIKENVDEINSLIGRLDDNLKKDFFGVSGDTYKVKDLKDTELSYIDKLGKSLSGEDKMVEGYDPSLKMSKSDIQDVAVKVARDEDVTLNQAQQRLADEYGVNINIPTAAKFNLKKGQSTINKKKAGYIDNEEGNVDKNLRFADQEKRFDRDFQNEFARGFTGSDFTVDGVNIGKALVKSLNVNEDTLNKELYGKVNRAIESFVNKQTGKIEGDITEVIDKVKSIDGLTQKEKGDIQRGILDDLRKTNSDKYKEAYDKIDIEAEKLEDVTPENYSKGFIDTVGDKLKNTRFISNSKAATEVKNLIKAFTNISDEEAGKIASEGANIKDIIKSHEGGLSVKAGNVGAISELKTSSDLKRALTEAYEKGDWNGVEYSDLSNFEKIASKEGLAKARNNYIKEVEEGESFYKDVNISQLNQAIKDIKAAARDADGSDAVKLNDIASSAEVFIKDLSERGVLGDAFEEARKTTNRQYRENKESEEVLKLGLGFKNQSSLSKNIGKYTPEELTKRTQKILESEDAFNQAVTTISKDLTPEDADVFIDSVTKDLGELFTIKIEEGKYREAESIIARRVSKLRKSFPKQAAKLNSHFSGMSDLLKESVELQNKLKNIEKVANNKGFGYLFKDGELIDPYSNSSKVNKFLESDNIPEGMKKQMRDIIKKKILMKIQVEEEMGTNLDPSKLSSNFFVEGSKERNMLENVLGKEQVSYLKEINKIYNEASKVLKSSRIEKGADGDRIVTGFIQSVFGSLSQHAQQYKFLRKLTDPKMRRNVYEALTDENIIREMARDKYSQKSPSKVPERVKAYMIGGVSPSLVDILEDGFED